MKNWIRKVLYGHYFFRTLYAISPKMGASYIFRRFFHRGINWDNPKNLQEKTYWLLYNTDTSLWTRCADKYRVREFVKEKGCESLLTELYGHWDKVEEIDFSSLPEQFVLKANNGCHSVMVVKNKSNADLSRIKKELKTWFKYPYGYMGAQKHYLKIIPCIVAEQMLEEEGIYKQLSPHSLVDYKIWCFSGRAECILVVFDRAPGFTQQAVYDLNWNNISSSVFATDYYKGDLPKPENLPEMIRYAELLSSGIPEVRVDFYNIGGKIYFGEMTFTAGYGDLTDVYYDYLGGKVILPEQ